MGFIVICLTILSTFAQTPPSVTFIVDLDGVLFRHRDLETTTGFPEPSAAYPPSLRITHEQERRGRIDINEDVLV